MKNTFFYSTVIALVLIISSVASANEVTVYCDHEFKDEIVEINSSSPVDSCVSDLIWGAKNVCFKGDAETLADLMNDKKFKWLSSGYSAVDASVTSEGNVKYTGVDAMSFYMAERTLYPCAPEFFNK